MPRSRTPSTIDVMEILLKAQLQALEDLRRTVGDSQPTPRKRPSHTDMAEDILRDAQAPLHARDIIDRIQAKYGVSVGRESLVSALLKHTARGRFLKTAANTFALPPQENRP
jgi:hypothetical protein